MFSPQIETATPFRRRAATFRNPIAPGADPWVIRHNGAYYWCTSDRDLGVAVYRSDSLAELGEKHLVWSAPETGPHCAQVWAPELHRLDGRWYIYVAASNGRNETHRMIVLESEADEPTAPFHFKSELYSGDDFDGQTNNRWAIDGTVLEVFGRRYLLWSGWADDRDEQWLYIAPMKNPWTLAAARTRVCANNDYRWERVGESRTERGLNEGPQVLQRDGRTFVIYSCSGSWEASYKLGLLELERGGDPLDPRAWRKHAKPVLVPSERICGVGHCSFTSSPDGTEDWIVYHAKVSPRHGWTRVIRAQRFTWTPDGFPQFGDVADGDATPLPIGDPGPTLLRRRTRAAARALVQEVSVIRSAGETSGEPLATT